MVKARVISLALLAPLLLAPTAANAGPSPRQTTIAKAATAGTPGVSAPGKSSTRRTARSKERIHTYKPAETEPQPAGTARPLAVRAADSAQIPFVGFSPIGNSVVGVGLWRIPKVDSLDQNRGQPLRDMRGKTGKAAAVGFQLNF